MELLRIRVLALLILVGLIAGQFALRSHQAAAQALGNLARSATQIVTDSNYSVDFGGDKAKDGVVTQASKWTSTGTIATHSIAYDLGGVKIVTGFVVKHAGAAGEWTTFNTQLFRFEAATSLSGPWTIEANIDNTVQSNISSWNYALPKRLRYVRLFITDPGVDNYARIPEFEVWGSTPLTSLSGSNQARSAAQAQTDSNYSVDFAGDKAKDGVITQASKWTSANTAPPHWIAYDLGSSRPVSGFIVRHAGAAGEWATFNTQLFRVQSASGLGGPWSDEVLFDNSYQLENVTVWAYSTAKSLRYVRLLITDPGADNIARIPEFEVWGNSPVPPSTPIPTPTFPTSLKGANWLFYTEDYGALYSLNDNRRVAWNLEYAENLPTELGWPDNPVTMYNKYQIRTLVRLGNAARPTSTERDILNNAPPASFNCNQISALLSGLNTEANYADGVISQARYAIHAFILGNEPNIWSTTDPNVREWGVSGRGYGRVYFCYLSQYWSHGNKAGYRLLAAGPGGCRGGSNIIVQNCPGYYTDLFGAIGTSVDGFAIHAYGTTSFKNDPPYSGGFEDQINTINANRSSLPIYITEYNMGSPPWTPSTGFFTARYNEVLQFNASHSSQIKALLYFLDSPRFDLRFSWDNPATLQSQPWWPVALRNNGDGRRDAWKLAP